MIRHKRNSEWVMGVYVREQMWREFILILGNQAAGLNALTGCLFLSWVAKLQPKGTTSSYLMGYNVPMR